MKTSALRASLSIALVALWPVVGITQTSEIVIAVSSPGVAGTMYQTDIVLTNLESVDASCTLTLLDPAHPVSTTVPVPEGTGAAVIENIYDVLVPDTWGRAGLLVECATAVGMTSRTFAVDSVEAADQRGQNIHGFGPTSRLYLLNPVRVLGLGENTSYYSNLTLINAGYTDVTVTTTRDATGSTAGTLVSARSTVIINHVLNSFFSVTDTSDESIHLSVAAGGPIAVYATLVQTVNGEFATLMAQPATGVAGPLVLPALRDGGLVTDLDLFNPGASPEAVTLTHSSGATSTTDMAPGSTTLADVLGTLGVTTSTGALKIASANPILAQGRFVYDDGGSGAGSYLAALPAQATIPSSFVQRLGAFSGVSTATTIVFSPEGAAEGYLAMSPPASPQPLPASVAPYLISGDEAAAVAWTVPASAGGEGAELTTDNSRALLSFLVSTRNQHDIMVTPFFKSNAPRPVIESTGFACDTGATFTARPDWPGLTWEWFADGTPTGLTSKSISASAGVVYHVQVTDPFFVDPGRSRDASPAPALFCDGFESGDLSAWSSATL
jgi:hypothetical protein